MVDVKWIKVSTSMFESSRKIKQIENMPEGDTILVIWLKLLLLAGNVNDRGAIYITPEIPYTDEMLATELRRPVTTVRMALSVFETFGMVEIIDNVYYLSSWEKYQSTDKLAEMREKNRERQARFKQNRKALENNVTSNVTETLPITLGNALDIDKDLEKDLDLEVNSKRTNTRHKYGEYKNVLLTDEELEKLKAEFSDWEERIERLSAYIAQSGKTYKSHLATIRNWARKDATTDKPKKGGNVFLDMLKEGDY
jgi:predicted phage replisome organizer